MKEIKDIVINCHKKVLEERGIDITPQIEMKVGRESGLDSLGIVNLIVEIEEELDMSLDSALVKIRKCKTVQDIVNIIQEELSK